MFRIYQKILRPVLFKISPETAHELGLAALRTALGTVTARKAATRRFAVRPFGQLNRFGLNFPNPLGLAAGFDKNGIVVEQLAALGFGFVELGTVTYEPQPGNLKPRLFRLPLDDALINRMGFNNDGAAAVVKRLKDTKLDCILGINIGKNKSVPTEEATENYLRCFELVHSAADYIAVNVSSPNTPNLRELQRSEHLSELLQALQQRNLELGRKPVLVKIAPDLTEADIEAIVDTSISAGIAAVIATNTTIARAGLLTPEPLRAETGGLSGRPLASRSSEVIRTIYKHSCGRLPIIGVGGIFSAEDAFEKIAAGACLLQAYTGFVYKGIGFAREINLGLAAILKERGFRSLDEAVGSGHSST